MTGFEAKRRIVEAGDSLICNEWQRLTNDAFTVDEFVDALRWLCDDPCDDRGRLTRELVLKLNLDAENRERVRQMNDYQKSVFGGSFPYDEGKVGGKLVRARRVYGSAIDSTVGFYDETGNRLLSVIGISARDRV